jgi:uncharacterized membrane protein YebE (DUF533 family)
MFDAKSLLDRVLGSDLGRQAAGLGGQARDRLDGMSGSGGFASGAAAGGILGLLLGSRGGRGLLGDVAKIGGTAAVGYLAYKAYRNWRDGSASAPGEQAHLPPPEFQPDALPATDGKPFTLALITSMVAAAKADGHVDATEQQRLFGEIERLGLGAEEKAFVFDLLARPISLEEVARTASTEEQGAELYLAARLVIEPDQPAEKAFLEGLAARLELPAGLAAHLDTQVVSATVKA